VATIFLLPLESHFPGVFGFSILFIFFAVLGMYVLMCRVKALDVIWIQPVFLAAYVFIGVCALLESVSPIPRYSDVFRFGQMIGGAILVASLCRDRLALRTCLYGYIGQALWLSVVLFLTSYGALQGVTAANFDEASVIRGRVIGNSAVGGNFNGFALMCVQGGMVALVFALAERSSRHNTLLSAAGVMCLIASLLAMSRTSVAIGLVTCSAILYAQGIRHWKTVLLLGTLGLCIYLVVPEAVWSRMTFSTDVRDGKMEGRADLYWRASMYLDEYLIWGIGSGNFWQKWGFEHDFASGSRGSVDVSGVHNTFLQVTINWGLPGLIALLLLIWQAYRCLPKRCGGDPLALSLLALAVSLGLFLGFTHNFEDKLYSMGIGMLAASRYWIWPSRTLFPVRNRKPVRLALHNRTADQS
jgi:O-antigen ligase